MKNLKVDEAKLPPPPENKIGEPKCPNCFSGISMLINYAHGVTCYDFSVVDGIPEYDNFSQEKTHREEFLCPECGGVVCTKEAAAVSFLKGA